MTHKDAFLLTLTALCAGAIAFIASRPKPKRHRWVFRGCTFDNRKRLPFLR